MLPRDARSKMKRTLVVLGLSLAVYSSHVSALRMAVLDVGEGQAVLLAHKKSGILIDTGHAGMVPRVLRALDDLGVARLDYLILTHLHPDHASGYFRIREAFPSTPVLDNCHPLPAEVQPDMVRWVSEALAEDTRRHCLAAGDRLNWQGIAIDVLWPQAIKDDSLNRHSLVLLLSRADKQRVLIMGDADQVVERSLLETHWLREGVDILIAGHHGAADTGDQAFLRAIAPAYSVVSVNSGNIRGYPAEQTLAQLRTWSERVLRTDRDGDLCFGFGKGVERIPCNQARSR